MLDYDKVIKNFPKVRRELPAEYLKIYDEHYMNNRSGASPASFLAMQMEKWLHKKAASTARFFTNPRTLEIGGDVKSA